MCCVCWDRYLNEAEKATWDNIGIQQKQKAIYDGVKLNPLVSMIYTKIIQRFKG